MYCRLNTLEDMVEALGNLRNSLKNLDSKVSPEVRLLLEVSISNLSEAIMTEMRSIVYGDEKK